MCFRRQFYFYVSILIYNLISLCKSNKYCDPDFCKNGEQHTMCKFKYDQPSTECVGFRKLITKTEDKVEILNKINSRRNSVAAGELKSLPPAVNMMKLVWNEELAVIAQRWANQCEKHSQPDIKDACRDLENVTVGQNIATIYGDAPGINAVALVDVWYTELLNANSTIIGSFRPSEELDLSHYDYFTQLVWANTTDVGCGGAHFLDTRSARNKSVFRLVCNFLPAGNLEGSPVYHPGDFCSQCPEATQCDQQFPALCRPDHDNYTSPQDYIYSNKNESLLPIETETSITYKPDNFTLIYDTNTSNTVSFEDYINTSVKEDDIITFDYFSHDHKFTREMVTKMVMQSKCNNIYDIDNLFEVLKKKLSTDPVFNHILQLKKFDRNETIDFGYTDKNVQAFMSHIYGQTELPKTTKSLENEVINSTLLADLIEAVIFRGGAEKFATTRSSQQIRPLIKYSSEIIPVRIQAELAKVNTNHDFTGHYFFPEDINESSNDDTKSSGEVGDSTELYYEMNSNEPRSDVVLQLEKIRKKTVTKDFIEDILESVSMMESSTNSHFLLDVYTLQSSEDGENDQLINNYDSENTSDDLYNAEEKVRVKKCCETNKIRKNYNMRWSRNNKSLMRSDFRRDQDCNSSNRYLVLRYNDLIDKLAHDINLPELNESLQCFINQANKLSISILVVTYSLCYLILAN